jgi:hypothetical protein
MNLHEPPTNTPMKSIPPTNHIQLDLTIEDTNLILEALGALPFTQVYMLIGRIQERARQQIADPSEPPRPAGADREHAA